MASDPVHGIWQDGIPLPFFGVVCLKHDEFQRWVAALGLDGHQGIAIRIRTVEDLDRLPHRAQLVCIGGWHKDRRSSDIMRAYWSRLEPPRQGGCHVRVESNQFR